MRQAAAEGRFDFRGADFFDRWWWRRLHWTLEHLEAENANRVESVRQNLHAGALTYGVGQEAFDCHWNQAQELNRTIYNRLFPWAQQDARDAYRKLAQAWAKIWGDPADPEVWKKIEDDAARLLASHAAAGKKAARERRNLW